MIVLDMDNLGIKSKYSFPPVTVAVCVKDGEDTIAQCLNSLKALKYPKDKLTILVVDNGSKDKTSEIVSSFDVEVINEKKIGRGIARNAAWRATTDEFIAFTDADCEVNSHWLMHIMPAFEKNNLGVCGSDIVTPGSNDLARFYELRRIVSNAEFSGDYPFSPPFLATANAVFRVRAIRDCGGFNEDYRVAEDADICWRIMQANYTIDYLPGPGITHHHRSTYRKMFNQSVDYGHDAVHLMKNFYPDRVIWIWFGLYYRLFISILNIPLSLFKNDSFEKKLPLLDFIRYSGLALGRLSGSIRFHVLAI